MTEINLEFLETGKENNEDYNDGQGCTNHWCHVAVATRFCTVVPSVCGS